MNARDAALLTRWSEHRDAEAFNDLVSHYADMVYATCKRTLGNPADAEELTQECFLKLATGNVRIRTSLGGWLHSAATSLSINRLRSDARRRRREEIALAEIPTTTEPAWNDIQRFVDQAIAELPEDLRDPLIRHFLQRETHDQIAHDLGVTRSAVTKRIAHGIDRVRETLKKSGVIVTTVALTTLASEHLAEAAPAALKATLGRLALSGAVPTAAAATGMTLLGKLLIAASIVVTAGLAAAVVYPRFGAPVSTPSRQSVSALPQPLSAEAKLPQPDAPSAPVDKAEAAIERTPAVAGKVYDAATRQGIRGAEVLLAGDSGRLTAETNEYGEYCFETAQPGTWYIICREANGYYVGAEVTTTAREVPKNVRKLELEAGQRCTGIDFAMERGEGVRGTAVDANGTPLAGAKVTAFAEINNHHIVNTAESREDGAFLVTGFPPTVGLYVWACKGDLVSVTNGPYALPQGDRALDPVVLQPEAILSGILQDSQGKPLGGLKFVPQFVPDTAYRELAVESGADGHFELKGVPAGSYVLRVCRDNEIVNSCPSISLAAGQVVDDLVLTCAVGKLSISGQAVDSRGAGLSWATVECTGGQSRQQVRTQTSRDGRFVIDGLEPGTYTLTATHQDHLKSEVVEAAAGSVNARLVLPDGVTVEGRVVDAESGKPVPAYEIKYCYFPDEMYLDQRYEKKESSDGSFKLSVAQLGDVCIAVRVQGYLMGTGIVPLDGTRSVVGNVLIRLKPQADLHGRVHDANGTPVVGAVIFSGNPRAQMEDSLAATRTGNDGTFVLPANKLGNDRISVRHPNYPQTETILEPKHYAGEPIDVTVQAGTTLACTVLSNGVPCPNAMISAHQTDHPKDDQTARTGPDGKCRIETLLPGECRVFINLPRETQDGTEATQQKDVTLVAGQTTELTVDFVRGDASVTLRTEQPLKEMIAILTVTSAQGEQLYFPVLGATPDGSSTCAFKDLPPGDAVLSVNGTPVGMETDRQFSRRYAFTLSADSQQEINLDEGATLWGTVGPQTSTDHLAVYVLFGKIVPRETLPYYSEQDFCAHIPVAADGSFRMDGFQPGPYTLVAVAIPRDSASPGNERRVFTPVDLTAQGQEVNLQIPE